MDGTLSATFNPTLRSGSLANNQPLLIGQNAYTAAADYIGEIDEVEVFNRAVSATDIANIYSAGSAGKCHPGVTPTPAPTATPVHTPTPTATAAVTPTPARDPNLRPNPSWDGQLVAPGRQWC